MCLRGAAEAALLCSGCSKILSLVSPRGMDPFCVSSRCLLSTHCYRLLIYGIHPAREIASPTLSRHDCRGGLSLGFIMYKLYNASKLLHRLRLIVCSSAYSPTLPEFSRIPLSPCISVVAYLAAAVCAVSLGLLEHIVYTQLCTCTFYIILF
ncbi:hypothetical protein BDZ97DRAFT_1859191 [Flammula alnicola]|nr:hypothetical protein BDZ97DRAFT_1859191 [Flammula alnicola]